MKFRLDQEGVKFGEAIPEATSLRRLSVAGSQLDAEELAMLLAECRGQIMTDTDKRLFDQALQDLTVPSSDNQRVPLSRIVRRTGRRIRGGLGGWIVSLENIDESLRAELTAHDFPYGFPDTTTGDQALDYIQDVWKRARTAPEGLANEVRQVLPSAYAYCREDCAKDAALGNRWAAVKSEAAVFAEREWIVVKEADDTYFDDIKNRRFFPSHVKLRTVTGGHLGLSRSEQLQLAEEINLPRLSTIVVVDWKERNQTTATGDWITRFELICQLLRNVRGVDLAEGSGTDTELGKVPKLLHASELAVDIRVGDAAPECVPVNARLSDGTLTIAGRPVEFGADAAKELLEEFSFRQRADLAADLTGMLTAIAHDQDFRFLAAEKFRRSHAPTFELQEVFSGGLDNDETESPEGEPPDMTIATGLATGEETGTDVPSGESPDAQVSEPVESDSSQDDKVAEVPINVSKKTEHEETDSTGGSYTKDRALASQKALADKLKSSLKGEIVPDLEQENVGDFGMTSEDSDIGLGDEGVPRSRRAI